MNIEFRKPAYYGDTLDFAVSVRRIGRSSLDLETVVSVRDVVAWTVRQRVALISADDHKSRPWPDDVRQGLTTYLESIENVA